MLCFLFTVNCDDGRRFLENGLHSQDNTYHYYHNNRKQYPSNLISKPEVDLLPDFHNRVTTSP